MHLPVGLHIYKAKCLPKGRSVLTKCPRIEFPSFYFVPRPTKQDDAQKSEHLMLQDYTLPSSASQKCAQVKQLASSTAFKYTYCSNCFYGASYVGRKTRRLYNRINYDIQLFIWYWLISNLKTHVLVYGFDEERIEKYFFRPTVLNGIITKSYMTSQDVWNQMETNKTHDIRKTVLMTTVIE